MPWCTCTDPGSAMQRHRRRALHWLIERKMFCTIGEHLQMLVRKHACISFSWTHTGFISSVWHPMEGNVHVICCEVRFTWPVTLLECQFKLSRCTMLIYSTSDHDLFQISGGESSEDWASTRTASVIMWHSALPSVLTFDHFMVVCHLLSSLLPNVKEKILYDGRTDARQTAEIVLQSVKDLHTNTKVASPST